MISTAKILFLSVFCTLCLDFFCQEKKLENYFIQFGLVDIKAYCSEIKVDLAYSSTKNFVGIDLYGDLNKCFLPKEVAIQLCKAQEYLHKISEYYNIIVFDATRPLHIQQLMWDSLKIPIDQKIKYLASPTTISLHNYGAAVDVGLITQDGRIVDMGTSFDYFGEEAQITQEALFVKEGKLTKEQVLHRKILRKAMRQAGFKTMSTEWWHFNFCTKQEAEKRFVLIL